jgi:N-methylhydantoinase A
MSEVPELKSTRVVAVDTGGTFTDVLLLEGGRLTALKVPSSPDDPAEAVLQGVRSVTGAEGPDLLLHGSTVATNALLERRGGRVALITNRGFEDVIEIGRQNRPQLYALVGHRPPPLVDRDRRFGISGRIGPEGQEIEPIDPGELAALAERVAGAQAVAVVLLHSYANAAHERAVGDALGPVAFVTLSAELLPEYREYERTSTTVVNAYVAPLMSRYLDRVRRESGAGRTWIMGSNGGALSVDRAVREPIHTVLSGPAGGVVGAVDRARRSGCERIISFDMGGTSTDVSLSEGQPFHTREFEIGGQPIAIPVIDIHTVGAGGGSLARVDAGGALRVGPDSAGADPGPVSYGIGGARVTVTDANVWLGRLPADAFLGGEGSLDRDAVEAPLAALAGNLGMTLDQAAEGVLAVANAAMERALRVISVERGHDPADFVLVAFGGAGGLHVAELAVRLGTRAALVPRDPGLLSAYGMLAADVMRQTARTVLIPGGDADADERIEATFDELEAGAISVMAAEGTPRESVAVERWVDARYRGQSFELRVPGGEWRRAFHRAHAVRYGYQRPEAPVEAVTLRVVTRAPGPSLPHPELGQAAGPPATSAGRAHWDGVWIATRRVWRKDLRAGHELEGPLQVLEYSSTTWVPEGWTLRVDRWGSLHLSRSA